MDVPASEVLAARLGLEVVCADAGAQRLLEDRDTLSLIRHDANPLLDAVHLAFSSHRPLVLGPDAIWLTIAQGIAQHVTLHAEGLRDQLVDFQGKQVLEIRRDKSSDQLTQSDWAEAISEFAGLVEQNAHTEALPPMGCDFSTTTPAARVASQVVLLEAFKRYFDYVMVCICGFPQITVLGTPADWEKILQRVGKLPGIGLGFWAERLAPICEQFVRAASGKPKRRHWAKMYKLKEAYGTKEINGWFTHLFPYVRDRNDVPTLRNPVLVGKAKHLYSNQIPVGLSKVPVRIKDIDRTYRRQLVAGLTGVTQDPETLALQPVAGWAVTEAGPIDRALEAIRQSDEHITEPRDEDEDWSRHQASGELMEFMADFSTVTLFADSSEDTISLHSPRYPREEEPLHWGTVFGTGPDGKILFIVGEQVGSGPDHVFPVCAPGKDENEHLVVAESVGEFLERCLRDGAFFVRGGFEPLRVINTNWRSP